MSSLAGLLVALTVRDGSAQREGLQTGKANGSTDKIGTLSSREDTNPQATIEMNSKRKADVLLKHRSTITRWTEDSSCRDRLQSSSTRAAADREGTLSRGSGGSDEAEFSRHDLMRLAFKETLGRHLVANDAIPPGTTLIRERPFAWSISREYSGEFCAHCISEMKGSKSPCPQCGLVAFCSTSCATAALATWHGEECLDAAGKPLEPALSALSTRCRVALRAVRRSRRQVVEAAGGPARDASPDVPANPAPAWHVPFGELEAHWKEREALEIGLLETEAAVAAVLAWDAGGDKAEGVGSLASDVANSLSKVSTNAFFISTLRSTKASAGQVETLDHARVAVGLYMRAAMLNHSCRPNASTRFGGGQMEVVTTRAIEAGEIITVSYGPLASKEPSMPLRRETLKEAYFFHCECAACHPPRCISADGASGETGKNDKDAESTDFSCIVEGCSGVLLRSRRQHAYGKPSPTPHGSKFRAWCGLCKRPVSPQQFVTLLAESREDARRWSRACELAAVTGSEAGGDTVKAKTSLVLQCIRWRDDRLIPDAMERAEAHDMMARILVGKGQFAEAAKHCELSVKVLERRFAPEDQELGMEELKLANICFQAGLVGSCKEACRRARVSLGVCLPAGDEQLAALDVMESLCRGAEAGGMPWR